MLKVSQLHNEDLCGPASQHLNMSSPGWMSRVATAHLPTISLVATVKGRQRPSSSCSAWCWPEQKLNKGAWNTQLCLLMIVMLHCWRASPDLPAPGAGGGGGLGAEEAGLHPLLLGSSARDVLCWVEAVTPGTSANLSILKIVL